MAAHLNQDAVVRRFEDTVEFFSGYGLREHMEPLKL